MEDDDEADAAALGGIVVGIKAERARDTSASAGTECLIRTQRAGAQADRRGRERGVGETIALRGAKLGVLQGIPGAPSLTRVRYILK